MRSAEYWVVNDVWPSEWWDGGLVQFSGLPLDSRLGQKAIGLNRAYERAFDSLWFTPVEHPDRQLVEQAHGLAEARYITFQAFYRRTDECLQNDQKPSAYHDVAALVHSELTQAIAVKEDFAEDLKQALFGLCDELRQLYIEELPDLFKVSRNLKSPVHLLNFLQAVMPPSDNCRVDHAVFAHDVFFTRFTD